MSALSEELCDESNGHFGIILSMHYVYILKDSVDKLYIGISKDLDRRIQHHNTKRGALFTKHGNFKIVFYEKHETLLEARQREIQIKKWRRDKKNKLIEMFEYGLNTKL